MSIKINELNHTQSDDNLYANSIRPFKTIKKQMKQWLFCPSCGKASLSWDGEKKWSCNSCDFTLYHNVATAVAVLVKHKDEILFTIRNREPAKGKLDLPGGFTDPKETAEHTCTRELWEELAWEILPDKLKYLCSLPNTYVYKEVLYNTLDLFYIYEIDEKPAFTLEESEIQSVEWRKLQALEMEDLAFDSQKRFFAEMKSLL